MMPDRAPRCYAVDDPATFPRDDDWPALCCSSSFTPWNMGACSEPKDWLLDQAFEEPLRELVRKMRGESDGHVPLRISVPDDPITTAANVDARCVVDLLGELTEAADNNRPCPMCASTTGPYHGWGLAGGGFGQYAGCTACGVFVKHRIPDDDEAAVNP